VAVIGGQPAPGSAVVTAPQQHQAVWDDRCATHNLAHADAHAVPVASNKNQEHVTDAISRLSAVDAIMARNDRIPKLVKNVRTRMSCRVPS
jgi:hypothetical protein